MRDTTVTYQRGTSARVVCDALERPPIIIEADLALKVRLVECFEQPESESGRRSVRGCRKPATSEHLHPLALILARSRAEALAEPNGHLVNACEVDYDETSRSLGRIRAAAAVVTELNNQIMVAE